MTQQSTRSDVTCRHCGATTPAASVKMESYPQPQPSGPWFQLEVWTCARCGWRNVHSRTERKAG